MDSSENYNGLQLDPVRIITEKKIMSFPTAKIEVVTSSYTFEISHNNKSTPSNNTVTTTVSGVNGVAVHQYPDGSLLPHYNDINMFSTVPNYDGLSDNDKFFYY